MYKCNILFPSLGSMWPSKVLLKTTQVCFYNNFAIKFPFHLEHQVHSRAMLISTPLYAVVMLVCTVLMWLC